MMHSTLSEQGVTTASRLRSPASKGKGATRQRAASGLEVRCRFMSVAEPLFLRLGYARTTVEEVCREARASKSTFYQHFRDRADLACGLLLFQGLELLAALRQQTGDGTARAKLENFFDGYYGLLRTRPCFRELQHDPQLLHEIQATGRPWPLQVLQTALSEILKDGQHRRTLRPLDIEAIVPLLLQTLDATAVDPPPTAWEIPVERRWSEARSLLLAGLLA